ncbi:protein kinase domain-containing protein [Lactiplantibacillus pingfangensis]|uniref:protein kinase domain-containing protein n=1 Tax=Lactiplantibacillus pingfangensis TaxID=2559915 RepID=UPI0010F647C5|nr:protein kinase [Lactiplantibacillus pingfangensis]
MLPIVQAMQLLAAHDYTPLGPLITGREFPLLVQQQQVVFVAKLITPAELRIAEKLKVQPIALMPRVQAVLQAPDCQLSIETLINGHSLADELAHQGTFNPTDVQQVALDVSQSLQQLAQLGIVHRDVKLSNIMVSHQHYYLIDISAAREYQHDKSSDTRLLGTSGFAAPENYGFAQTDGRSDIYSLGIVLNCLLTGNVPTTRQASMTKLTTDEYWRPIIERATAIDPQQRYQTATDFLAAITPQQPSKLTASQVKQWLPTAWPRLKKALWWSYVGLWLVIVLASFTDPHPRDQVVTLSAIFIMIGLPVVMHLVNRWVCRRVNQGNWVRYRWWLRAAEAIVVLVLISWIGQFMS